MDQIATLDALHRVVQTLDYSLTGHGQPVPFFSGQHPFSQFHHASFRIDHNIFPTAEHWMMYAKARMFEDPESAEAVLAAQTPLVAKRIGRSVKNFDAALWSNRAMVIVAIGSLAKYTQNPTLLAPLLNTGERPLLEASPYDRIWGIGINEKDLAAGRPWTGRNQLGQVLMAVRHHLIAG